METLNPVELAAQMIAVFVSNNSVPRNELPALIQAVHGTLAGLANGSGCEFAANNDPSLSSIYVVDNACQMNACLEPAAGASRDPVGRTYSVANS